MSPPLIKLTPLCIKGYRMPYSQLSLMEGLGTCTYMSLSLHSDEHKRHSKDCPFLKLKNPYTITVGDILDLERKALEYYIVS